MKNTYSLLFALFTILSWVLSVPVYAQTSTASINGHIATPTEAEGLPFANVLLKMASDSSMYKAAISDVDGNYQFNAIPYNTYFVEVSFVGMATYTSPAFVLNTSQLTLDDINLTDATEALGEVVITAKRPVIEVLADKTVFNVENTINATGSDGFELLRKAPGVIIDNNNNLIVEGKSGVLIFVNNKPSPLSGDDLVNFLRSLQASDIDAIEIITQPSSKYDAAGNAGIINIKLRKDKRYGTNGTASVGYARGLNNTANTSISFNTRTKKHNVFGTYSNNFGKSWNFINLDRYQAGVRYNSETNNITDNTSNNVRLGYDFFPSDKHTVGVLVDANIYNNESIGRTETPITVIGEQTPFQTLIANNNNVNDNLNFLGNINYRFADTLGHELLLDVDYGKYQRDEVRFQPNAYLAGDEGSLLFENNYRMITPIDIDIFTAKADYSQNLLGGVLGVGVKHSNVNTDNVFDFFDVIDGIDIKNTNRSNEFTYREIINAAYLNYNYKLKKWNMQLGLRMEQTISEGNLSSEQSSLNDNVKRNYVDWFPSGGLTFTPNFSNSFAFNYSRRIQRPNYQSLNPFENQLDELSIFRGNPFLQPQYTNNLKVSHTYKYTLTTSLSYTYINDFFAQVTDTLGATKNFMTTENVANQQVITLGISYPFQLAKWWNVYANISAFRSIYTGADERFVSIDQNTMTLYAQNTFSLPKNYKLELSGWFSSPSVWGGTYLTKSLGSLDIAVQKRFFNEKLSARIAVSDILFTSPWRADMTFGDLYITGRGGWESRRVRLNISYAFGSSEVKSARKRKTGIEDENKRVE